MRKAMKKNSVFVIEGKDGHLTAELRGLKKDLSIEPVNYDEVPESLSKMQPDLVVFNLDSQKEAVEEIVRRFSKDLPHTIWVVSAPKIGSEELIDFMRLGVSDFLPQPVDEKCLEELLSRTRHHIPPHLAGQKDPLSNRVVSFFSPKGGVGVSFLAVNTAVQAARTDSKRSVLADLVLQHGNVADLLDLPLQFTWSDISANLDRLDEKFLQSSLQKHPSGLSVLPRPRLPEDSEQVGEKEIAQVIQFFKKSFSYTFLDLNHELDPKTLVCLDCSDIIFVVITPDMPSLCSVSGALQTFKKLGYPEHKVKLILNRWDKKGELSPDLIQENLSYPLAHQVAEDASVSSSINRGIPLAEFAKHSPLIKSFQELVHTISKGLPQEVLHGSH